MIEREEELNRETSSLRVRAEAVLTQLNWEVPAVTHEQMQELIHDFRVHQIELELQNDELRTAQDRIEEARNRYAQLFNQAPMGYIALDNAGVIRRANHTFCTMVGAEFGVLPGRALTDYVADDDRGVFLGRFKAFFKSPEGKIIDLVMISSLGTMFNARLTGRIEASSETDLQKLEMHKRIFVIVDDITEQKAAEDALRASEERHRAFLDSTTDLVSIKNRSLKYVLVNNAFQGFMARTADEILGKTDLDLLPLAVAESNFLSDQMVLRGGGRFFDEVELMGRIYETRKFKVALGKDEYGVGVLMRDVTDAKNAAELRIELERKLLTVRRFESLAHMAGGIAHDFNNLLQVVLGNLEIAFEDQRLSPETRNALLEAHVAGKRAAELTGKMLAFSGRRYMVMKSVPITGILQVCVDKMRGFLHDTVETTLNIPENLPTVVVDVDQIHQVIMNLLINAVEAIGNGVGRIDISCGLGQFGEAQLESNRVDQKAEVGAYVWVDIADNGCGMDAKTKERLFEPFFSTKFTGRGLGMPEVLGILRGHKGAIFVDSESKRGTKIRIALPAHGKDMK